MEEKLYTSELKRVLLLTQTELVEDYPITKNITVDYFILAVLQSKQSNAYKILLSYVEESSLVSLHDFYAKFLAQVSSTVKPLPTKKANKEIGFDVELSKYLLDSSIEKDKLTDPKLGSEHILLAILAGDRDPIKRFKVIGVDYNNYFNEINKLRVEDLKSIDSKDKRAESFGGSVIGQLKNNKSKKTMVETYCVNLNTLAQQGKIDELIGREVEVKRLIKVLGRRNKNNLILVGNAGTGKSQIISGLANKIENNDAMFLNGKVILSLNMTSIIAGTTFRGALEDRLNSVFNEIKDNKEFILFIDDIHTVLGGNSNQAADIAGILSTALSDSSVQVIATTSFSGYKSAIENNSTLSRRFQKIVIEPTSIEETEKILFNSKKYYEEYHNVIYSVEAIKACVSLANKYITERQLPDSAIDIMDECGSEKKVIELDFSGLTNLKKELVTNQVKRDKAMKIDDYKLGDDYNSKCNDIKSKIVDLEKSLKSKSKKNIKQINENDVYNIVSEMTGVPITKLSKSDKQRYMDIEKKLGESVIGQSEAIKSVAKAIKRGRMGLGNKNKPIASLLMIGPSGTGKTMLAKKLADEIFGSEGALVRFDMSEYADKTSVNKLIGSNYGYANAEQGGLLTEAIKKKPYCVLLLDEIEKADKEVYQMFLQVLDNGVLTDAMGIKVSFRNVIVIMTSNLGAKDAVSLGKSVGFGSVVDDNKKSIVDKSIKNHFSPEFLGRIDDTIHFNNLGDNELKQIIELELVKLKHRVNEINYDIEFGDGVVDYLLKMVVEDKASGARKINRVIQNEIENDIVDLYLGEELENGYVFKVIVNNNKIEVK